MDFLRSSPAAGSNSSSTAPIPSEHYSNNEFTTQMGLTMFLRYLLQRHPNCRLHRAAPELISLVLCDCTPEILRETSHTLKPVLHLWT